MIDENETKKKVGTVQYRKLNANNICRFNIMLDKVSFENVYKEHDANLTYNLVIKTFNSHSLKVFHWYHALKVWTKIIIIIIIMPGLQLA